MTNQPSQPDDRIRAAVEKNPRKMTLQLARDLGVPEVEVLRAFPPDRTTELDIRRWEELLCSLEVLGSVRVLVRKLLIDILSSETAFPRDSSIPSALRQHAA